MGASTILYREKKMGLENNRYKDYGTTEGMLVKVIKYITVNSNSVLTLMNLFTFAIAR